MTDKFPRVTYTNQSVDFTALENHFDKVLVNVKNNYLGQEYGNVIFNKNLKNNLNGSAYQVHSPIDGTLIGTFYDGTKDVPLAMDVAKKAQKSWGALSYKQRAATLQRIATELNESKYLLAAAVLYEVGKNRMEALGEAEEVVDFVTYYCDEYVKNNGYNKTMKSAKASEVAESVMLPYGVFGVISPFNFPLAMSINMIVGAILTGNTVVWKPTKNNALSSYLMLKAMIRGGLPEGVVNLVNGGDEVGKAIVAHPELDGLVFTGSNKVGMSIMKEMITDGKYARPCIVEMGGKNPSYVCASADLKRAALGVSRSAFGMSGQKCSANSKVYVHESIHDEFVAELVKITKRIHVMGDVRKRNITLGPVINKEAEERFKETIERLSRVGILELGGKAMAMHETRKVRYLTQEELDDLDHQTAPVTLTTGYCLPTIFTNLPLDNESAKQEYFLPIISVIKFGASSELKTFEEAIAHGNDVLYGLTSGIFSEDRNEIDYYYNNAENGVKYVNRASGATTGTWPGTTSFVGWKGTGSGGGKGGLGPNYLPQFLREQSRVEFFGND